MTETPREPADDDIAGVRYGDLKQLDTDLTEARALIDEHRADLAAIVELLELDLPAALTDHQLVVSHILPALRKLVATQALVDTSAAELRARAEQLDVRGAGKTIKLAPGVEAQLVGRRLPPGMLKPPGGKHGPTRRSGRHT